MEKTFWSYLVVLIILFYVMINPAMAQQVVSDPVIGVRFVPSEAAIEMGPSTTMPERIRLGLGGTFARLVAQQAFVEGEEDPQGTMELTYLWVNTTLKVGDHWTGRVQIALNEKPISLKQAYLEYATPLVKGDGYLRVGRFYLPERLLSLPPHWKELADGSPLDESFTHFGEGLGLGWKADFGGLALGFVRPIEEYGEETEEAEHKDQRLPSVVVASVDYTATDWLRPAAMFQVDTRHPDEDWLASIELSGHFFSEDWHYELLGVYRERSESIECGAHECLEFQPLTWLGCFVQGDWLSIKHKEEEEKENLYRVGGAVWVEPIPFLRLQAEVEHDWVFGPDDEEAIVVTGSAAVHF